MAEPNPLTQRLRLTPLSAADRSFFSSVFTCRRTMQFSGSHLTLDQSRRNFEVLMCRLSQPPIEHFFWRVELRATATPIGVCFLQPTRGVRPSADLGLILLADHHGKGFGRELVAALVDIAPRIFPIEQIQVQYRPENLAAERLFTSAGFVSDPSEDASEPTRQISAYRQVWVRPRAANS